MCIAVRLDEPLQPASRAVGGAGFEADEPHASAGIEEGAGFPPADFAAPHHYRQPVPHVQKQRVHRYSSVASRWNGLTESYPTSPEMRLAAPAHYAGRAFLAVNSRPDPTGRAANPLSLGGVCSMSSPRAPVS